MGFSLEDETALAELQEITSITNRSMTAELGIAIHERLERLQARREAKLARIKAITRRSAPKLRQSIAPDRADSIYDDLTAIPKE